MDPVIVQLPYPPSVNNYWRSTYSRKLGRVVVYLAEGGKAYRSNVEAFVWQQLGKPPGLKGQLRITLAVTFPDKLKRDLDNLLKALLDSLQHAGVYEDDNQLKDILIRAKGIQRPGKVEVEIEPLDDMPLFGQVTSERIRENCKQLFKP